MTPTALTCTCATQSLTGCVREVQVSGTSPKFDELTIRCTNKIFIVGFGGGRRGLITQ